MLPWEQLRLVLAVARYGALSGAARALGLSSAGLDAALTHVERTAGAPLFVREDGRLLLTDAGRSALHTGERMSEEMARVNRALPEVRPGPHVRVRVGEVLAARWLEAAATDLARRLGNVTLEVVTAPGRRSQGVDLEVTSRRSRAAGSSARALGLLSDGLYGSEAYLLDHGRPARPDLLVGHRVVLLTGAPGRTEAGRWLLQASRDGAQVALRTDSVPVFVSAVRSGMGLGVLPRGSEDVAPELVCLASLPEIPVHPLWLVVLGAGQHSTRIRRAARAIEETLGAALRRWQRAS